MRTRFFTFEGTTSPNISSDSAVSSSWLGIVAPSCDSGTSSSEASQISLRASRFASGAGFFRLLTLADFSISGLLTSCVGSSVGTSSAGDFVDLDSIIRLTASEDLSCFCSIARWSKLGSGLGGLRGHAFFGLRFVRGDFTQALLFLAPRLFPQLAHLDREIRPLEPNFCLP